MTAEIFKYHVQVRSKIHRSGEIDAVLTYETTIEATSPAAALGLADDVLQTIAEKITADVVPVHSSVSRERFKAVE